MSIDAHIERVTRTEDAYELELCGRAYRQSDGHLVTAPPGQPNLTILNPTWQPSVGMSIWGDGGTVIIEANPPRQYTRIGYTRMKEK